MLDIGHCNTCHQEIRMTQVERDIYQAEMSHRLKYADVFYGGEFDTPKLGDEIKIPMPHWSCGHFFVHTYQSIKMDNGRYVYAELG